MKIAISSSGEKNDSLLDPRFGRCVFYALYDSEEEKWSFLPNPGAMEGSGAGLKAAQFLIEENVDVLLTGDVGPNASRILNAAEIKVYTLPEVALEEALQQYEKGECKLVTEATVSSHAGINFAPEARQAEIPLSQGKIAVATDGAEVAQHFGRCSAYTLVETKDGTVVDQTVIPNPGHQPGFLPRFLAEKGVNCVIAGGMGPRAQNLFAEQGINTIIGVTGPVAEAIESYLSGSLVGGDSLCEHGHGHGDGHHDCGGH
jgi:predicted Fe-Mo cluster-binding NifX family protein